MFNKEDYSFASSDQMINAVQKQFEMMLNYQNLSSLQPSSDNFVRLREASVTYTHMVLALESLIRIGSVK